VGFDRDGSGDAVMSGRELVERVRQLKTRTRKNFMLKRYVSVGQADRHGVSAKAVHQPRTAGEGEASHRRRRQLTENAVVRLN